MSIYGSTPSPNNNNDESTKKLPSPFVNNALSIVGHQTIRTVCTDTTAQLQGYRSRFNIQDVKQNYQSHQQNVQNSLTTSSSRQQDQRYTTKSRNSNPHRLPSNHQSDHGPESATNNSQSYWCELCERKFRTAEFLERHVEEHERCYFDGCKYEAHTLLVQKHIETQHDTGLFQRIGHVESEEDIEKWRTERRNRYPTRANIELRQMAQEARMKRGERLEKSKARFGRMSDRRLPTTSTSTIVDAPADNNRKVKHNNRANNAKKRQRKRPRKGLGSEGSGKADTASNPVVVLNEQMTAPEAAPKSNALSALCMYASDSDENDEDVKPPEAAIVAEHADNVPDIGSNEPIDIRRDVEDQSEPKIAEKHVEVDVEATKHVATASDHSDDEPPDEEPIEHHSNIVYPEPKLSPESNAHVPAEKLNLKRQNNRNNNRVASAPKQPKRTTLLDLSKRSRKQNTLLEKLLEKDIRHERNVLLQCVRYVVANDFFGVGGTQVVPAAAVDT